MKIITGRKIDLLRKLDEACKKVRTLDNEEDKFEYYNYIGNLYAMIDSIKIDYDKVFGTQEEFDSFMARSKKKNREMEDNFLRYRTFHNIYLGDILDITNDGLSNIELDKVDCDKARFSEDDFYSVFYEFLKTLGLEKEFDRFIKERKLFSKKVTSDNDYGGCILIDPISCDMSVFAGDFQYNLESMFTCSHEFGHVFDLKDLKGDNSACLLTNYFYKSLYNESISGLFEKLLADFLLKQNIMRDEVLEKQAKSFLNNYDYVLAAYIFTLFEGEQIRDQAYAGMSVDDALSIIGEKFEDKNILSIFLHMHGLKFPDDLGYSYGGIMSTFLKDSIDKEGFESKLFRDFMDIRTSEFTPHFIEKHDLSPKQYKKLYNQEIKRIQTN